MRNSYPIIQIYSNLIDIIISLRNCLQILVFLYNNGTDIDFISLCCLPKDLL